MKFFIFLLLLTFQISSCTRDSFPLVETFGLETGQTFDEAMNSFGKVAKDIKYEKFTDSIPFTIWSDSLNLILKERPKRIFGVFENNTILFISVFYPKTEEGYQSVLEIGSYFKSESNSWKWDFENVYCDCKEKTINDEIECVFVNRKYKDKIDYWYRTLEGETYP